MRFAVAGIVVLLALGCDGSSEPVRPKATGPQPTFGNATITGHIRFAGAPPERKMIDTSTCQSGNKVQQEETVVVGEGGGLRDVIVYLKDAPASDGSAAPEAVLDQVGCRYTPHALAIQVGQPLKITTTDDFLHNVHYTSQPEGDVNFGLTHAGESKVVTFDRPQFVRTECNVHAWMNASVGVMSSPFFAVTVADGSFTISRVPAGHYTIAAWHPLLGERTAAVDIAADGKVDANLDFGPPTKP
jgi:plastocyanin